MTFGIKAMINLDRINCL